MLGIGVRFPGRTRRVLLAAVVVLAGHVPAAAAAARPSPAPVRAPVPPATPAPGVPVAGYDISWPNCPKGLGIPQRRTKGEPMPPAGARLVVIGLTNGPGFYPNPCLASQVRWARGSHAYAGTYAVASFPRPAELARYGGTGPFGVAAQGSRLRNAGYAQARVNLATAAGAGLATAFVWIDIEPVRGWPWSEPAANRALLDGLVRGYTDAGVDVGFYSYRSAWREITGGWRNSFPAWVTGATSPREAVARCARASFSGGPVLLSQWYTKGGRVDHDVTCPRPRGQLDRLFMRF